MKSVEIIWERRDEGPLPSMRDDKFERIGLACDYFSLKFKYFVQTSPGPEGVASNMEAIVGALGDFLTFLMSLRRRNETILDLLSLVDDALLVRFRDWAYERTKQRDNSKQELTAKRTTNGKLRHVYDWMYYCTQVGALPPNTIGLGENFKIISSLPDAKRTGFEHLRTWKAKYPLLFPKVGSHSRDDIPQFWATNDQVSAILNIFEEQQDVLAGERNMLLTFIGNDVGWRGSSVLSLSPDDFSEKRLDASRAAKDAYFLVRPRRQKGGKKHPYYIPWPIAERIHQYVVGYTDADGQLRGRPAILKRLGLKSNFSRDHIFLATDTGHPLRGKTLTDIFSDAFRAVGAPKGAGYHGLRRKSADEAMRSELEHRMNKGLSTAMEDVVDAVSDRFGWSSRSTYKIYMRVMASLFNGSVQIELKTEISMLRIELMDANFRVRQLEAENARLRAASRATQRRA